MRLDSYPRPQSDTGLGFHYFPDAEHYGREHLGSWLSELQAMGTSWLVVVATPERAIPEYFLRELVAARIEPVVRLLAHPIGSLEARSLAGPLRAYAACGVHYLTFYDRPNLVGKWASADWAKPALVERFIDALCPCWEQAVSAGLFPVLTPLEPGGDYWDTAFLARALQVIEQHGNAHIMERLAIGAYPFVYNRPLSWGQGGPRRWPQSRPYSTPPGAEDQRGFHVFDWYEQVIQQQLGRTLPIIALGSGVAIGNEQDDGFPPLDEKAHAQRTLEMAHQMMAGELPESLFNLAFWLLCAGDNLALEPAAWFRANGTKLAAVEALRSLERHPRAPSVLKGAKTLSLPQTKPIYHYLLLGSGPDGIAGPALEAARVYVQRFQPALGFRPEEAMLAEFVTIVGDIDTVDLATERVIRVAGCKVERIAGRDAKETRRLLEGLAQSGQRFLSAQGGWDHG